MNTVNLLLRISSAVILLLLLHQLFFSKKGTLRHRVTGIATMAIGVLIFVLVAIRGFHKETPLTIPYGIHLFAGGLFFFLLFRTGYLGYRARNNTSYIASHRSYAKATLVFLVATLIVGIISFLSH